MTAHKKRNDSLSIKDNVSIQDVVFIYNEQ